MAKAPPIATGKLLSLRLYSTLLKTPRHEAVAVILFGEHLFFRQLTLSLLVIHQNVTLTGNVTPGYHRRGRPYDSRNCFAGLGGAPRL